VVLPLAIPVPFVVGCAVVVFDVAEHRVVVAGTDEALVVNIPVLDLDDLTV
jgi:hypothetical protein